MAFREPERAGTATVAEALAWINQQSANGNQQLPWFAWVHLYEPHFPYAPPEPYATRHHAARVSAKWLIAYGGALASSRRAAERARALDRTSGLPPTHTGLLYLMAGAGDKAAAAVNEALTIDATLARAHKGLGVVDA